MRTIPGRIWKWEPSNAKLYPLLWYNGLCYNEARRYPSKLQSLCIRLIHVYDISEPNLILDVVDVLPIVEVNIYTNETHQTINKVHNKNKDGDVSFI